MGAIVLFLVELFIFAGTLVLWSLLSGFGCAMNTAGCGSLMPDLTGEALRIFMPPLLIGLALMAGGLWKRYKRSKRKG